MSTLSNIRNIAARFTEPSSWAGLTGILAIVGLHLDPTVVQDIIFIGAGVCGLVAFFLPEK